MRKVLLVTDTSGKDGRLGLVRAGGSSADGEIELLESVPLAGGTFSAQLVPQVAALLGKQNLSKNEIDAFVVISGPGSFTGLRVGLAAVKGLAEILQKPIVAVSLLEVLALTSGANGKVLVVLDAGRGEVYMGEYEIQAGTTRVRNEQLVSGNGFLSAAQGSVVSTPNANLARMARDAGLPVIELEPITMEEIARVGSHKLQAGETVSPEHLEANYMRCSDAEVFSKPASGS